MGTPAFAVYPLRLLVENGYHVAGVVTAPDKPAGRGLKPTESAVKKYAVEAGLPILQPFNLKDEEFLSALKAWNPELGIVVAFRMLPEAVWAMPPYGTFNLHASLLPQYRGAAPINWAIINGEKKTGVTTFMLDNHIDTGGIIDRREVCITAEDSAGTLHDKLMTAGGDLVLSTVCKIASGSVSTIDQSHVPANELKSAPKIFRETARLDWNDTVENLYNKIRGLSPYPAAWTDFDEKYGKDLIVKIFKSRMEKGNPTVPGKVYSDGKETVKISCSDGYIVIDELQLAGKKRMTTAEFLRGNTFLGTDTVI